MKSYYLSKSSRKDKKYMIKSVGGKIIHFGQFGASDYTIHHDEDRKKRYILRHSSENFNNLTTASAWSRWILWNKPSLNDAIKSMERRFGISIIY